MAPKCLSADLLLPPLDVLYSLLAFPRTLLEMLTVDEAIMRTLS